ncbi:hypothetical protein QCA50_000204 [Cerrena zonata]|uniref:WD40 repeat-like protein n=1 Tax=Cerrena zonata TaxID=2478898 RepID=A0AAW0GXI3_9APHY
MRTKHASHPLPAFPVYSCAFVSPNEVVLGGGGGQSRSGIKNKLRLYRVDDEKSLELLDEFELDKGEDAPMSMAAHVDSRRIICGVNSSEESLKSGENQNCRLFGIKEGKLSSIETRNTLSLKPGDDDFQKVSSLSPDGSLLAVAGNRDLSLLNFPSLSPAASPLNTAKEDIYDAAFSSSYFVVATTVHLLVYSRPPSKDLSESPKKTGKQKASSLAELELVKTIDRPTLPGKDAGSSFRAIRFHPGDDKTLYAIINSVPPRTRTKSSPRRAFICKINTETWQVGKIRKISDQGVTCFDISPNGKFLAFGSANYTVGILDSKTFAPLLTILKAHDFPPTALRFNPASNLLVSGSVDNSIRVVTVPDNLTAASWSSWIIVLVTLLVILFAILAQQMHQSYMS